MQDKNPATQTERETAFRCPVCGMEFKTQTELEQHEQREHKGR